MAIVNLRSRGGPLRTKRAVTIASVDIEIPSGSLVEVVTPASGANLTYRPLENTDADGDVTEQLDAGRFPAVCGVPIAVRTIRGASTVTQVYIGEL